MTSDPTKPRACDVCSHPEAHLLPCGDHFHYFCGKCTQLANPDGDHWQCEACGTVYAEYVNGCPKCWDKDIRAKVVGSRNLIILSAEAAND